MPHVRVRDICVRCLQGPKTIKARKLCESCYMHAKANGTLNKWPVKNAMRIKPGNRPSGYCQCYSPIAQRVHAFDAVQCLKCGKKLPDDHQ